MHEAAGIRPPQVLAPLVVVVGGGVRICVALIDPAGGDPVAEHLRHIFFRHFASADIDGPILPAAVVDPVLKVVAVAPLVVQPRQTHAVFQALLVVGAAPALVVFYAPPKLRGAVFAQVVGQTLPHQTQLEAIVPHQAPVTVDGM